MRKKFFVLIATLAWLPVIVFGNDYEEAWKALHNNDRNKAQQHLEKAMQDPKTAVDAYLTYVYLQKFRGKEAETTDFAAKLYAKVKDPNAYLYALWFNGAVLGEYGKKTKPHNLQLLEKLLTDPAVNGSIRAAAHYSYSMHFVYSNKIDKAYDHYKEMYAISEWQFAGPFDNLSGSGFNKNFGPLDHPEPSATFISLNNANIKWFAPSVQQDDGWTSPGHFIRNTTALVYAQSFIKSPADMKVLLNAGGSGNMKVWVNDELVISEPKDRLTELDCYKSYVELKKGYNRVLVQLGYVNNSFPNFIIRFTDGRYFPIKELSATSQYQPYPKAKQQHPLAPVKHFAEAFFEEKIKAEPENCINYILLSETYLRNKKTAEARRVIESALKKYPDNCLLRFELILCLWKDDNRTLLAQEVERMKEKDPSCRMTYQLNIQRLINEEKYDEALAELDKEVSLFGISPDAYETRIELCGKQKKIEDMIRLVREAYAKYPEVTTFVRMMYSLQKNGYKDNKAALKVYEDYIAKTYDFAILSSLSDEYFEQGMPQKGLKILEELCRIYPWDPELLVNLVRHYFEKQDYKKALKYAAQALELSPYTPAYHENLGLVYEQLGKKEEAVKAYTQALYYDHNRFDTRYKIRSFQNKPDIYKAFPQSDPYELIKNAKDPKEGDHNFYYVLDEKFNIVYPEGATEEFCTTIIKVLTQKGIDSWKEMYIPYDPNGQTLNIEKAEVVKKNGSKVPAERSGNELVFTGLEVGDAIVVRYKTQDYYVGRLAREFWSKFTFSAFVPTGMARYCLLAANNISFNHIVSDNSLKPVVTDFENFKLYTWEQKDIPALKEEPLMPNMQDIGTVVHVSTMKSWDDVARWYSDLVTLALEDDYEVKEKYAELFPAGKTYSQREKAMIIYDYIVRNISYSSVPFRQSAFVPQKPSKTINTRLGDCKDLSALFVSLARMAGLHAHLLLVDTRNEGQKQMLLPMVEFNHCIVKVGIDGKEYYLELTDNNLPFGSLPNNIINALSLEIPYKDEKITGATLKPIKTAHRTRDMVKRTMQITITGEDLNVETRAVKTGALSSSMRDQYKSLSAEKQREDMEKAVSRDYKNPVKVDRVSFSGLDRLDDSVSYVYSYTVKNEVVELGDMGMIKVPYTDVIATLDKFTLDKRAFPIEYWSYENTDEYETIIRLKAPPGKQFFELPKDESVSFKNSRYSLRFIKEKPDELTIIRKASLVRENIAPADYAAFKEFFNRIVKVEAKYVGFK